MNMYGVSFFLDGRFRWEMVAGATAQAAVDHTRWLWKEAEVFAVDRLWRV